MLRRTFLALLAGAIALATIMSYPATANLRGSDVVGGSGFGALPRRLTTQSHGPSQTTESGCIAPPTDCRRMRHGQRRGRHAPPIWFPKRATPSLSSLGITNASQVGMLFDATQPQNASNITVTINDSTLMLLQRESIRNHRRFVPGAFDPADQSAKRKYWTTSLYSTPRRRRCSTRRLRDKVLRDKHWERSPVPLKLQIGDLHLGKVVLPLRRSAGLDESPLGGRRYALAAVGTRRRCRLRRLVSATYRLGNAR